MKTLRLGMVGLDTSHVEGFAALLNNPADPHHVPGGRVTVGYPGGSEDFPLSKDRVDGYTRKLREHYQVTMVDCPRAVAEAADAILLTSVDGRVHLRQFAELAAAGKPVFVDKPFATTHADACEIHAVAQAHRTPYFSSSSLRFAGALESALADPASGAVIGADFYGPLKLQPTQPGFFWYGIHTVEMLYATLGSGCVSVRVLSSDNHEIAVGLWRDGRVGVARGNRAGNDTFGGIVHREKRSQAIDVSSGEKPDVGLTRAMMAFFQGGPPPVRAEETIELIRFLEAANESRDRRGEPITL